jgi:hypothetical protein
MNARLEMLIRINYDINLRKKDKMKSVLAFLFIVIFLSGLASAFQNVAASRKAVGLQVHY